MNTREKILDRALEMFNERGIEYVGLRELAAVLDMRVSNITYYFPTKDDLVFQLSQDLSIKNSEVIVDNKDLNITGFLVMLQKVFENQYQYRGLLRSFVHIMTQNKQVLASYKKTQTNRKDTLSSNIHTLVKAGYIKVENDEELNFLVSALTIINRYWISEAAVFSQHLNKEQQVSQNLIMVTNLFMPYASPKARREMEAFREERIEQKNRRTEEQKNRGTEEQKNRRTAEQRNSRTEETLIRFPRSLPHQERENLRFFLPYTAQTFHCPSCDNTFSYYLALKSRPLRNLLYFRFWMEDQRAHLYLFSLKHKSQKAMKR